MPCRLLSGQYRFAKLPWLRCRDIFIDDHCHHVIDMFELCQGYLCGLSWINFMLELLCGYLPTVDEPIELL